MQALARALRVRMADAGLEPREIAESGMGYANLLFIATVLAQLDAASEADLTLLLVEEPEAHLHPPLQALLLDYLRDAAAASRSAPPAGRWRGYLQVVITSSRAVPGRLGRRGQPGHFEAAGRRTAVACRRSRYAGRHGRS